MTYEEYRMKRAMAGFNGEEVAKVARSYAKTDGKYNIGKVMQDAEGLALVTDVRLDKDGTVFAYKVIPVTKSGKVRGSGERLMLARDAKEAA